MMSHIKHKLPLLTAKLALIEAAVKDGFADAKGACDVREKSVYCEWTMTMEDWATRIDKFLEGDDRPVLDDAGSRQIIIAMQR